MTSRSLPLLSARLCSSPKRLMRSLPCSACSFSSPTENVTSRGLAMGDFTPLVERISIDEAFADVAGTEHLFGPAAEIAKAIRRRVRTELGLPISIGVARTKHLAKIASQVAKPDGLVVVDPETELDFLHHLPVELMWGVGPVTSARLAKIGVHTIGELAKMPGWSLERIVGRAA